MIVVRCPISSMVGRRRSFRSLGWPTSTTASRAPASLTTSPSRFRPRSVLGWRSWASDEQRDRLAALADQVAQLALAPLALARDPGLLLGREVVEQRGHQGLQGDPLLVDRERPGGQHLALAGELVLELPPRHRLAGPDQAAQRHQAPGLGRRLHLPDDLPVVLGLEEAGLVERRRQAVMLHHLAQHRPSPERGAAKRARTRASTTPRSRVSPRMASIAARSSAASRPSGTPRRSAMARLASIAEG